MRQALAEARSLAATKEAERALAVQAAAQQSPLVDALEAELAGLQIQVGACKCCITGAHTCVCAERQPRHHRHHHHHHHYQQQQQQQQQQQKQQQQQQQQQQLSTPHQQK